jgi:hypothetical protein
MGQDIVTGFENRAGPHRRGIVHRLTQGLSSVDPLEQVVWQIKGGIPFGTVMIDPEWGERGPGASPLLPASRI